MKAYLVTRRAYVSKVKDEIYNAYGGYRCACCGITEPVFLAIDHINNDGAAHRKKLRASGTSLHLWIKRKGFPKIFQILCHNCNWGKRFGVCMKAGHSAKVNL